MSTKKDKLLGQKIIYAQQREEGLSVITENLEKYNITAGNGWLEDVTGDVESLVGGVVTGCTQNSGISNNENWAYFEITTDKGYVNLRFLNDDSEYYGVYAVLDEDIFSHLPEIFPDFAYFWSAKSKTHHHKLAIEKLEKVHFYKGFAYKSGKYAFSCILPEDKKICELFKSFFWICRPTGGGRCLKNVPQDTYEVFNKFPELWVNSLKRNDEILRGLYEKPEKIQNCYPSEEPKGLMTTNERNKLFFENACSQEYADYFLITVFYSLTKDL
jgi:hypothetical protein